MACLPIDHRPDWRSRPDRRFPRMNSSLRSCKHVHARILQRQVVKSTHTIAMHDVSEHECREIIITCFPVRFPGRLKHAEQLVDAGAAAANIVQAHAHGE